MNLSPKFDQALQYATLVHAGQIRKPEEAKQYIKMTISSTGRQRDLAVLDLAVQIFSQCKPGGTA